MITFLLEAVEASLCYFFKNWLMKHKSPNLLKPLGTIIHQNSQFYYPSEPFSFHHFNVRHPVSTDYTPLAMVFNILQKSKHFLTLLSINFKNLYELWKDNTHVHIPKLKHLFFAKIKKVIYWTTVKINVCV